MKINILKCHGSGNDFLLIDEYSNNYNFSEKDRATITKSLCNRKGLLGADGILFFTKSSKADAAMRIINSDGSEAEMCGNGLRCLGRYALEFFNKDEAIIETLKENLKVKRLPDIFTGVKTFQVTIKPVVFQVEEYAIKNELIEQLSDKLLFTTVSLPNPHIVTIVDEINEEEIDAIGSIANTNKNIFKKGVNLNFVKILGENSIYVQTYERGVGLTNACGTGMSSSSLVSCLLGYNKIGEEITVINRGGMVKCQPKINLEGEYSVELMGNATYMFEGHVEFDFNSPMNYKYFNKNNFNEDMYNYDKLAEYSKGLRKQ